MKALVVYDSYFGNTEKVASALCGVLSERNDVITRRASEVTLDELTGIDVLVVGSPTRGFRPSEATRKFLKDLPDGCLKGVTVAAFDTRISVEDTHNALLTVLVKIFGYAAEPIAKKLEAKGGERVVEPAGFYVKESEGPLKDGELKRAVEWVRGIPG